jgi:hypothetical protein
VNINDIEHEEARKTLLFANVAFAVFFIVVVACLWYAMQAGNGFYMFMLIGAAFSFSLGLLFLYGLRKDMRNFLNANTLELVPQPTD